MVLYLYLRFPWLRPAKILYDATLYITLQKTLYVAWGPPNIGGILEPAAIFATLLLAFFLRRKKRAFWLTFCAGFALLLAFPVVFFTFVAPENEIFLAATPTSIPPNWLELRTSWETGHAIRFVLQLVAMSLLLLAVLLEGLEGSENPPNKIAQDGSLCSPSMNRHSRRYVAN